MAQILFSMAAPSMKYLYVYRNIAVPASLVTVLSCFEIWRNESLLAVSVLSWVKIFTTALLILYIHLFREHTVFFFMNLGIGRFKFYVSMFALDMTIFFVLATLILVVK